MTTPNFILPTRVGYRFKNRCPDGQGQGFKKSLNNMLRMSGNEDTAISDDIKYALAVYRKGNVLQYKNNSSNLTKNQIYSQIAKGMWTNRTTTWASQSETVTNPNTKMLKQLDNGYISITTDIINNVPPPVDVNALCIRPIAEIIYKSLPKNRTPPENENNQVFPSPPSGIYIFSDIVMPELRALSQAVNLVVPDGGTLVCNVSENPCTGQILNKTYTRDCYPTNDSDVPGPTKYLCWNEGLPTYYPRQRLTYGSGNNKWPYYGRTNATVNEKVIYPDFSETCAPTS